MLLPTDDEVQAWPEWLQAHTNHMFDLNHIYRNISVNVDIYIMDTGSNHTGLKVRYVFTQFRQKFIELTILNNPTGLIVEGIGHVGALRRCLYIPSLTASLISLTHYLDYFPRHEVIFSSNECIIRKKWRRPSATDPNPNANRVIAVFPRTANNVYATWDLSFLFPVIDLTAQLAHDDGVIEAKIDGVDEVQFNMNVVSPCDSSPLRDIVNLFQIEDGVTAYEASITNLDNDEECSPDAIVLNLVENDLPDLVEANTTHNDDVETIIDSGANKIMFKQEELITDMQELVIPIQTAGQVIYSAGIGTIGRFKNCLWVPDLKKNLISVTHVCDQLPGAKVVFSSDKVYVTAPDLATSYVGNRVNGLYKVLDLEWMGIKESPRPETVYNNATLINHVANYCKGVAMTAAEVDAQLRCQNKSS